MTEFSLAGEYAHGGFSGWETCFHSEKDGSGTGLGEESQINGNDRL